MGLKTIVKPAPQTYGPHGDHKDTGNIPDNYGTPSDKGQDKITNPRK